MIISKKEFEELLPNSNLAKCYDERNPLKVVLNDRFHLTGNWHILDWGKHYYKSYIFKLTTGINTHITTWEFQKEEQVRLLDENINNVIDLIPEGFKAILDDLCPITGKICFTLCDKNKRGES